MLLSCLAFLFIIPLFFFFAAFGMAIVPSPIRDNLRNKHILFLLAPFIGSCVWMPLTLFAGIHLQYTSSLIVTCVALTLIFIWYRRKNLSFSCNLTVFSVLLYLFIFTFIFCRLVSPWFFNDGGLYFSAAVYDYSKSAIIDAIATKGLFPLNPWLADDGFSVPLIYYFGWHAWAAQLSMLSGISGYTAEIAMAAFTFLIVSLFICGITWQITDTPISIPFTLFLLTLAPDFWSTLSLHLPESFSGYLFPAFPGFWTMFDNFIWSPQHMYAAAVVIFVIYLFLLLLRTQGAKPALSLSCLIALAAAAGLYSSVYAAAFPFVFIALIMIALFALYSDFRYDFLRSIPFLSFSIFLAICLTVTYFLYLIRYPSQTSPLEIGIIPCYGLNDSFLRCIVNWLNFYLFVLPTRLGLVYILGILAIFIPGTLPSGRMMQTFRALVLFNFVIIFFVHSTYYSNDFGWRSIAPASFILLIFSVILSIRFFHFTCSCHGRARRLSAIVLIFVMIASQALCFADSACQGIWVHRGIPSEHVVFARAIDAWRIIRENTSPDDLVLSNPKGFFSIGCIYNNDRDYTNVFFALFARRRSPIGDAIFAKCYSEFYDSEKLNARYNRAARVFAGKSDRSEIDWIADDLRVRAIMVTPLDGLWDTPGAIAERYKLLDSTADYRIYLLK